MRPRNMTEAMTTMANITMTIKAIAANIPSGGICSIDLKREVTRVLPNTQICHR
jgi:hypothetical protein